MKYWPIQLRLLTGIACLFALSCPAQIRIDQFQRNGTLTWTNSADLTEFQVQSQTSRSGPWTTVAFVNSTLLTNSVSLAFTGPCAVYRVGSGLYYSENAVGFANLTLQKGYNLIGTPFITGTNGLIDIFPPDCGLPLDTFMVSWDPLSGSTGSVEPDTPFFYPGMAWDPPGPRLQPGRGFFLYIDPVTATNAPYTVTLLGEVQPASEICRTLIVGGGRYNALANPQPYPGLITTDLNLHPADEDVLLRWDSGPYQPYTNFYYIPDVGWNDGTDVIEPTIGIGQGFMLFRLRIGPSSWCGPFIIPANDANHQP